VGSGQGYPIVLNLPGTVIDCPRASEEERRDARTLMWLVEGSLNRAALALHMLEKARAETEARFATAGGLAARGPEFVPQARRQEKRHRRKSIAGDVPRAQADLLVPIFAEAFVFSLDNVGRVLALLADSPCASPAVAAARDEFSSAFPDLVGVRNTSHHLEDRARRRDRRNRRIKLAATTQQMGSWDATGVLVLSSFSGDRFFATTEAGSLGQVEVNAQSLHTAVTAIQKAINGFPWIGPASQRRG
jgi:hypothetical protein